MRTISQLEQALFGAANVVTTAPAKEKKQGIAIDDAKPVWEDPDDASLVVDIAGVSKRRKLRQAAEESAIDGVEYQRRLQDQLHPPPSTLTA